MYLFLHSAFLSSHQNEKQSLTISDDILKENYLSLVLRHAVIYTLV